jgi:Domain of unknown function (DUF4440)
MARIDQEMSVTTGGKLLLMTMRVTHVKTKLVMLVCGIGFPMGPLFAQLTSPAVPAAPASEIKKLLVGLERESWAAWKERNAQFYRTFLSEDHVEVYGTGVLDKNAVLQTVGSAACEVRSYVVDSFELHMLDATTALLTYRAAQDTSCGGHPVPSPAWVSSLYLKRGDRWLNVFYQQSPTPSHH